MCFNRLFPTALLFLHPYMVTIFSFMCSTHLTSMNVSGLLTTSVSWQTWWKRCGQLSDWWTRYAFRQTQRFNNTSSARNRVQRKLEERFCDCMEPNSAVPLNPKTSTWCSTTSGVRLHMSALRNRHFLSCSKKGELQPCTNAFLVCF